MFIHSTLFLRKNILKYFITIFIIIFFSIEGFNTISNFKYLNLDKIKSLNDVLTKKQESKKIEDIAKELEMSVTDVKKIFGKERRNEESKKIEDVAKELEMSVADIKKILGKERRNEESRLKKTFKAIKDGQHVTQRNTVVDTAEYVSSARTLIWNKIIKNYEYKRLFG